MPFEFNKLARIGSSQTDGIPTVWQYISLTDDTTAIGAAGYFNEIRNLLQRGDRIFVTGEAATIDILNVNSVPATGNVTTEPGGGAPPPNSVGTAQLQDNAVTTPKIENGAVIMQKLDPEIHYEARIIGSGTITTTGGATTEVFPVTGIETLAAGYPVFTQMHVEGPAKARILEAKLLTNNNLTVVFDLDPQATTQFYWQVIEDVGG